MELLKIGTYNVRGLADRTKRRKIYAFLKDKKLDVILLQEVHSQQSTQNIWRNESGANMYFSHGETDARGVAVIIAKKSQVVVNKITTDNEGRVIILDITCQDKSLTIANIYAPNEDRPQFYTKLFSMLADHEMQEIIIGGDFNLAMNPKIDRYDPKANNNEKAKQVLKEFMNQLNLIDVWRFHNPEEIKFTWQKIIRNGYNASRIDMFLLNYGLLAQSKSQIKPAILSDHSLVIVEIEIQPIVRGPGLWKLNVDILNDIEYAKCLNDKLDDTIASFYKETPDDKWEILKESIINCSKTFSQNRAHRNKLEYKKLLENLEALEAQLAQKAYDSINQVTDKILKTKDQMSIYETKRAKGAMIRAKYKWYTEGETSSKYYLGLEKTKYSNKTMKILIKEDNTIVRDQRKILMEQRKFYNKLFTANPQVSFQLINESGKYIEKQDRDALEKPLSIEEFSQALKTLGPSRTPGIDGLPSEVYKYFWAKIKNYCFEAFQWGIKIGTLHQSAQKGILCLIPKNGKSPENLKHWRPITLLSTDQKIYAKCLALRLKPVLNYLISDNQTGYLEGKFIGMNLRRMIDLITYIEKEEIPALLISVDFEKCFDSVSFQAIEEAMRYFGFGEKYIYMVTLLYRNFRTYVLQNGYTSTAIYPQRGLHQGCAQSGYVFLLVAEMLALEIKQNKKIKGIPLPYSPDQQEVISQFADDTALAILFQQESLQEIINTFDKFYQSTGLKANFQKTTIFRLGPLKNTKNKLKTSANFKWENGNINMLGVLLDSDLVEDNYCNILDQIKAIVNTWKIRNVSIKGKIVMLNSLIGSLLVYKMQVLPKIDKNLVIKINRIVEKYIWNGRKPKLKLKVLQGNRMQGGLALFDLSVKDATLKLAWIKRWNELPITITQLAYYHIQPKIVNTEFWQCNFKKDDVKFVCSPSGFWADTVDYWAEYNYHTPQQIDEIMYQRIWLNSHIRVEDKPIVCKNLLDQGIYEIRDIVSQNGIMTYQELTETFKCKINIMEYNSILTAIPKQWKRCIKQTSTTDIFEIETQTKFEKIQNITTKQTYLEINENEELLKEIYSKWGKIIQDTYSYEQFIKIVSTNIVKNSKYDSFHYRLCTKAILLNDRLYHMKITETQNCSLCGEEKETLSHFFVNCKITKILWKKLLEHNKIKKHIIRISRENNLDNVILNDIMSEDLTNCINVCAIVFKQKLFAAKCKKEKLNINAVVKEIEFIHKIESDKAKQSSKANKKMMKRWNQETTHEVNVDEGNTSFTRQYIMQM